MARIIDLKNKKEVTKQHGAGFNDEKPWRPEPTVSVGGQEIKKPEIEKKETEPVIADSKFISWSGQLYYQPDLKLVISISLLFFAIAILVQIFQKNVITTIFFSLLGIVILLHASKKPQVADFEVSPMGVKAYAKLYSYREIKSFWIEYDLALGIQELSLQLKRWYVPYLKIPIENQNPVQLRTVLLEFIPEVEHQDSLVEILSRKLGM